MMQQKFQSHLTQKIHISGQFEDIHKDKYLVYEDNLNLWMNDSLFLFDSLFFLSNDLKINR